MRRPFAAGAAGAAGRSQDFGQDFDTLWRAIDARYAYLESRDAWKRARSAWRKKATSAGSREQFVTAVEGALRSLHDDHVTLSEATPRSPRRVPRDTDVWASWREGRATIEAVRYAGDADYAGVHPGDVVTRVDGRPVEQATSGLAGRDASPPVRDWALRHVLAGPREGTVVMDLAGAEPRRVEVERNGRHPANAPAANGRRIGEARDIGYLRLRNLADPQLGAQLDGALAELRDTRALIIDLREATPGPRATTLAMLARFAVREAPWQIREGRD